MRGIKWKFKLFLLKLDSLFYLSLSNSHFLRSRWKRKEACWFKMLCMLSMLMKNNKKFEFANCQSYWIETTLDPSFELNWININVVLASFFGQERRMDFREVYCKQLPDGSIVFFRPRNFTCYFFLSRSFIQKSAQYFEINEQLQKAPSIHVYSSVSITSRASNF